MRLVGKRVEAVRKIGFDPAAHGLLVLLEMPRDAGNTPSGLREAYHLQAFAGTGWQMRLANTLMEFLALLLSQTNPIHGVEPPRFSTNKLTPNAYTLFLSVQFRAHD